MLSLLEAFARMSAREGETQDVVIIHLPGGRTATVLRRLLLWDEHGQPVVDLLRDKEGTPHA